MDVKINTSIKIGPGYNYRQLDKHINNRVSLLKKTFKWIFWHSKCAEIDKYGLFAILNHIFNLACFCPAGHGTSHPSSPSRVIKST